MSLMASVGSANFYIRFSFDVLAALQQSSRHQHFFDDFHGMVYEAVEIVEEMLGARGLL